MIKDYPFPLSPATKKKVEEAFGTFEHPADALELTSWLPDQGPDALQQIQKWHDLRSDVFEFLDNAVQEVLDEVAPEDELTRLVLEQLSAARFAVLQANTQLGKIVRWCVLTWQEDPLIRGTARKVDAPTRPVDQGQERGDLDPGHGRVEVDPGNGGFGEGAEPELSRGAIRKIPVVGIMM
jgi:hypothetical protein